MLTIDDPDIERFVRAEAARTGLTPADVLRRFLPVPAPAFHGGASDIPEADRGRRVAVRNGVRLLPDRPGEPPVTPELVRRLLDEDR